MYNPFITRSSYSEAAITVHLLLYAALWVLLLGVFVWYSASDHSPLWSHSHAQSNLFTPDRTIMSLYWLNLLNLQFVSITYGFFTTSDTYVQAVAELSNHYIADSILYVVFVFVFVNSYFIIAGCILLLKLFNLVIPYSRYHKLPLLLRSSFISGPLAWNIFAVYWVAFCIVPPINSAVRIMGLFSMWGFLGYGLFFGYVYTDHTMGLFLSAISFSISVHHFRNGESSAEWISPAVVAAILYLLAPILATVSIENELARQDYVNLDTEKRDETSLSTL